jgi:branched-chain amino acid transport system substrate-binding protein
MKFRMLAGALATSISLSGAMLGAASAETLKIGVIAPLTGGGAPWGKATEQAARIAANEVNAKGGLKVGAKTYTMEVVAYDDQYKPADSVAAFTRLVGQDQVKYVVVFHSPGAIALKQKFEDEKVVGLTASGAKETIDANTKFLFRLNTLPDAYMEAVINGMRDSIKSRRLAIINPNDATGWAVSKSTEPLFKAAGFDLLTSELYERSQNDFLPILTKIFALKPDVIDIGATPPATAGLLVRQIREQGYKGPILKTGGPGWKEIVGVAGPEASEGLICLLYADPTNEGYQRIAAEYQKAVGQEPNEMLVLVYDGIRAMFSAIEKSGDVNDTTKVAASFASIMPLKTLQGDAMTLSGKQYSGADQQLIVPNFIGVIKGGIASVIAKVK